MVSALYIICHHDIECLLKQTMIRKLSLFWLRSQFGSIINNSLFTELTLCNVLIINHDLCHEKKCLILETTEPDKLESFTIHFY